MPENTLQLISSQQGLNEKDVLRHHKTFRLTLFVY
jgi:hypothetical protein